MDHIQINTVIIGAGVVGVATARELALRGVDVAALEAEPAIGSATSARNSGVIHAGLYYPPSSLKARLCIEGRDRLYGYAKDKGIWRQPCGKLVVATDAAQVEALHALKQNAETNGVQDLRLLTGSEAKMMEPELFCMEALHVPISGVIDVHGLLHEMWSDAENHGAILQCQSKFIHADKVATGFSVIVKGPDHAEYAIDCERLINAAGLGAQAAAANINGYDAALIPAQELGKGSYFFLEGKKVPFSRLIYPMPKPGTSGLHFHSDRDGRSVFGPDLEMVGAVDFRVDPARVDTFYEAIRLYYPRLQKEHLVPDYAGIRPKLKDIHDFVLQTEREHGIAGLVQCFGIESPGLTACMALGGMIADLLN